MLMQPCSHHPSPYFPHLETQCELELRCLCADQHLGFAIQCPPDARVAQCLNVVLTVGQQGAKRCSALAALARWPIEMHAPAEIVLQKLPPTHNGDLAYQLSEVVRLAYGAVSWEALC
jgi:hypothetical protein